MAGEDAGTQTLNPGPLRPLSQCLPACQRTHLLCPTRLQAETLIRDKALRYLSHGMGQGGGGVAGRRCCSYQLSFPFSLPTIQCQLRRVTRANGTPAQTPKGCGRWWPSPDLTGSMGNMGMGFSLGDTGPQTGTTDILEQLILSCGCCPACHRVHAWADSRTCSAEL